MRYVSFDSSLALFSRICFSQCRARPLGVGKGRLTFFSIECFVCVSGLRVVGVCGLWVLELFVFFGFFLGGFCLFWVVWVFLVPALVGCFLLYITCVLRGALCFLSYLSLLIKKCFFLM